MDKKQGMSHDREYSNTSGIDHLLREIADRKARREALNHIAAETRTNRMHNARHWGLILFIWFSLSVLVALIVGRLWHVVTPVDLRWLSKEDLARIDEIFVDGSMGALLVGFFQDFITNKK